MSLFNTRPLARPSILLRVAPFALLLLNLAPTQAQPKPGGKRGAAVKHAEAILGKPLTEAQKKAIRTANGKRQKAIKPIQDRYKIEASKALGMSLAQYTEREKKLRPGKGLRR